MSRQQGMAPGGKRRQRPVSGGLRANKIGGNIYELHPANPLYITGTGFLVDTVYEIPEGFRLNKVEVTHMGADNLPTGTPWICDVHMNDLTVGAVWRPVMERATTLTNVMAEYGVEFNWQGRRIRVRTSAPNGNLIYPLFTVQFIGGLK